VGNAAFQQLFNQHVNETWRFTHNRDVVPSLPPQLIGFHHVAREVRQGTTFAAKKEVYHRYT
jgi:hypothetical protein